MPDRRWPARGFGLCGDPDPARAGERNIRAFRVEDLAAAPADKLVDVAGVVGKEHERLKMFSGRTGVVAQSRQGEIDPAGVKVRQRRKFCRVINPVGGLIANLRQFRRREVAGQPALMERSRVNAEPSITYG
jgi:hypothetical protein